MSTTAGAGHDPPRSTRLWTLAGGAAVLLLAAGGFFWAMNPSVGPAIESGAEDELGFLEIPELLDGEKPRELAPPTLTDVYPAVHRDAGETGSTIVPASDSRPDSNPSVWLVGTIEEAVNDPAPAADTGAAPQDFSPFSR